jgi:hypothetical protein
VGNAVHEPAGSVARRLGERLLLGHHRGEQAAAHGTQRKTVMSVAEGELRRSGTDGSNPVPCCGESGGSALLSEDIYPAPSYG